MHPLIKTFYIIFLLASSLVYANEFSNNLKDEDSPYLQQHVHNPVNWYAWNDKALQKAKDEHKLIFLSIGYSTCHWCHVMAKESFEDKNIAQLLNKDYVSIKVDREELPHLDKYYQNLHILLKRRSGGWPLTVILSEEAKAFFVGTYIPAYEKQGWEGLSTILPRLAKDYKQNRTELIRKSVSIENMMRKAEDKEFVPVPIDLSITKEIYAGLQKQFDEIYYGFSIQPKFPESAKISLLFDLNAMGEDGAKEMALKILKAMALHGLYDQTEGGFFRYSTDAAWEIPHFEKMLYTNAELIPLYVKAFELSGEELYKKIVIESIEMIEDRFEKEGLYFSASDADSDHEEGAYFIYNEDEIKEAMKGLRDKERDELIEAMDISEIGNFEDKTHINFFTDVRPLGFSKIKQKLKDIRRKREYPFIDKKINTAWNAMMIEALFYASQLDKNYADLAEFRMEALLNKMYQKGILYHQSLTNKMPKQKALLEDYAFLISALIQAYESTYDDKYLFLASQLSQEAVLKFYDGRSWYLNAEGTRVKADMQDKYYTAPMNKMLMSLLKLSSIKGERKYLEPVNQSLKKKSFVLNKDPSFYPSAMQLILRQKRGFVTLKATKERLLKAKENIRKISYPFILTKKDEKLKNYLACDLKQCFAIENELDEIVQKIDKY